MLRLVLVAVALTGFAGPAAAEFLKIDSAAQFRQVVTGKTLTRPLIKLRVDPKGRISGKGMQWDVTGSWSWRDGYFCRDLVWGGDDLGYNCQEVRVSGNKIRFTSDRGAGDYADFRLR
ncbi:MAG: dihydrodipicolinate reductase [Marinibacterium sp.]|nr:dihydrodipicolinate reductase [Marinibacterium sp.]